MVEAFRIWRDRVSYWWFNFRVEHHPVVRQSRKSINRILKDNLQARRELTKALREVK